MTYVDSPRLRVKLKLFQSLFEYVRFLVTVFDGVVCLERFVRHFGTLFDTYQAQNLSNDGGHSEEAFIQK